MDLLIDPDADAGFDVNFFGYLTDTATPREQTTSKTPDLGEAINFGIIDDGNDDDGGYSIFINNTELAFWQVEPASDDTNSPSLFFTAVFTVEQDAGGLFDATLELTDNSGVLPVSVYSDSLLDISDPGLAGVGDLYAGFGGRARNGSGIEALDNFGLSVTAIPEPTALAAVGVLGAMSLRRRR
ncbi:MAG: PEP-CTERM sorting domain-containing protein [Planctomycetota bacterium]